MEIAAPAAPMREPRVESPDDRVGLRRRHGMEDPLRDNIGTGGQVDDQSLRATRGL